MLLPAGATPTNWSCTMVTDLGSCSSAQLEAMAAATSAAAAALAAAVPACSQPPPMMPLDIQESDYLEACSIRGKAGGATAFARGVGLYDPAHAEAVKAGRAAGGVPSKCGKCGDCKRCKNRIIQQNWRAKKKAMKGGAGGSGGSGGGGSAAAVVGLTANEEAAVVDLTANER